MDKIDEGLRVNDLINLIRPVVSIDEYESKIDDDAIVVGFYVESDMPAQDLANFIEKGANDILDTEVSPAPDDNGNYVVFVEFLRNDKFPQLLEDVLGSVESLTGITEWQFMHYGGKGEKMDLNQDLIMEKVRLVEKEPSPEENEEEQMESLEFFKDSLLDDVVTNGKKIILTKGAFSKSYDKIALGEAELLIDVLMLDAKPLAMDFKSLRECNRLRKMLGENWDVNKIDHHLILANDGDSKIMVIK